MLSLATYIAMNVQKKCLICDKKIKLLEEAMRKCKCNNYYCVMHLDADSHNCKYDYKQEFIDKAKINNIKVDFDKLKFRI